MIRDNIKYSDTYIGFHDSFKKVFAVLKELNGKTSEGKIKLDENMWINVTEVKNEQKEDFLFEAHRNFLDIHYVISGEEQLAYAQIDKLKSEKEYNKIEDCELLKGTGEIITLKKGDFCIVYPQDAHAPFVRKSEILKKAVVKIRIETGEVK